MLDGQLFGLSPGGHHLGNVLLHGGAAIFLFLVLWRMTSALWRSAFVAAVFAIHPLRVESVAWVTERKDVLSGVFFMLTLAAYVRHVRHPQSPARYIAVVFLFALGLLCKSMLVTLPLVLLLLDYWPLSRFSQLPELRPLLREKVPLVLLSVLCAVIQLFANHENIVRSETMSLLIRTENAVVSCADYIGKMFHPVDLVVFYPHPGNTLPASKIAFAFVLLIVISAAAFAARKRQPWLLVGWLWYLGMLVPVLGLVQSGDLARADRYTYLPQIGLYIALTWTAGDFCAGLRHRGPLLATVAVSVIAALAVTSRRQTAHWRDSETLWNHALACNPDNAIAHENLGSALDLKGRHDDAIAHHRRAVEIKPDYGPAFNSVGSYLLLAGRVGEAIPLFQKALEIMPANAVAHSNLANCFLKTAQFDDAIAHFRRAIEITPDFAGAEANLGGAFLLTGRAANAIEHYEKALELQPGNAATHANLASALLQTARTREAVDHLQTALALQPDFALAHARLAHALLLSGAAQDAIPHFQKALDLEPDMSSARARFAWLLSTHPDPVVRDGPRAFTLAQQASEAAGNKDAAILRILAAACAEAGHLPEAVQTAQHALQLPEAQTDKVLNAALRAELEFYQSGSPFHEAR